MADLTRHRIEFLAQLVGGASGVLTFLLVSNAVLPNPAVSSWKTGFVLSCWAGLGAGFLLYSVTRFALERFARRPRSAPPANCKPADSSSTRRTGKHGSKTKVP